MLDDVTSDPLLLEGRESRAENDAAPRGGSPLIGAGVAVAQVDVDVRGRPVAATPWIGAHAFTARSARIRRGSVVGVTSTAAAGAVEEVIFDEPFDVITISSIQSNYEEMRISIDGTDPLADFGAADSSYTFGIGREVRVRLKLPYPVYGFRWRHDDGSTLAIITTTGEIQ